MRKPTARNFVGGILTGLASIVASSSCGVTPAPELDAGNLPSIDYRNTEPNADNTIELWEGLIIESPNKEFNYAVNSSQDFRPTGTLVSVPQEFGPLPFNVNVNGTIYDGSPTSDSNWTFSFSDNDTPFESGTAYPIGVQGIEGTGPWSSFGEDFFINDNLTDQRWFYVKYNKGYPFEIGDGFCNSANGENNSNSPSDCKVTPTPPYVVNDGVCNSANGENNSNSPNDCPLPPVDNCATNVVGDGICNLGCEDSTSEDCSPSTGDLIKGGAAKAYFVDGQGNKIDSITTNPATVRIKLSSQLEKRLKSSPAIFDHQENGPSDCINVSNYTQPAKTSPGIFDAQVFFSIGAGCKTDEVPAMLYRLEDKEGNVYEPIIGSAFVNHENF